MTALLLAGGRAVVLESPLVRASDAVAVRSSAELLAQAELVVAHARAEADGVRAQAEAEGRRSALAEAEATVRETLVTLAERVDDALAERRADIAAAALAATRAILGTLEEAEVVGRLADGVLARAGDEERVVVRVAAAQAAAVAQRLAHRPFVTVEADVAAGPFACSLATADGTVVADLPVQLAALADRWGVAS